MTDVFKRRTQSVYAFSSLGARTVQRLVLYSPHAERNGVDFLLCTYGAFRQARPLRLRSSPSLTAREPPSSCPGWLFFLSFSGASPVPRPKSGPGWQAAAPTASLSVLRLSVMLETKTNTSLRYKRVFFTEEGRGLLSRIVSMARDASRQRGTTRSGGTQNELGSLALGSFSARKYERRQRRKHSAWYLHGESSDRR